MSYTFRVAIYLSTKIYVKIIGNMCVCGGGGGRCECLGLCGVSDQHSMQNRLGMSGLTCTRLALPL